jgi:hypothetical protein
MEESWEFVCEGDLGSVWVMSTLYRAESVSDHFFIRVAVLNESDDFIAADMRPYWELVRPVQYVGTEEEDLTVIDIATQIPPDIETVQEYLLADFEYGQLKGISPGGARSYYIDFNAGSWEDVEALQNTYLFIGVGGWIHVTDGSVVEQLSPEDGFAFVRLDMPVAWDEVPVGSLIGYDSADGVRMTTLAP